MIFDAKCYDEICFVGQKDNVMTLNPLRPGEANMRHGTVSSLVQAMSCRLFGTKPLPEPMMTYCQWDTYKQTAVKF